MKKYFYDYYRDEEDDDFPQDPYAAWGMEAPDEDDDYDSDFGNWGND